MDDDNSGFVAPDLETGVGDIQLAEAPQGVSLVQGTPDTNTNDLTSMESPQYYQRRRLKSLPNNPAFVENTYGERSGKRCYVDPFEPFPQATYYLNTSEKRPKYEAQKTKRNDANLLRNRLNISKITENLQFHSKKTKNNKGLINQDMDMELNSDSENDEKFQANKSRNIAVNAGDAGGAEFDVNDS